MQSWDLGSLVPSFSEEPVSRGRVPSALLGTTCTDTSSLKACRSKSRPCLLDMLQGFWINFSTDPNKALQNLKSFPRVPYTSCWSHAWFLNRLCTFVWFTDLPFPLPLVLFVLLPLSSGKLVLIFWDLNKCALGPELVALSSGLSYYSANSSTMLITMGIKFICLCLSLLPLHWVSWGRSCCADFSLCPFQILLHSVLCPGRLTSLNCTSALLSLWLPGGICQQPAPAGASGGRRGLMVEFIAFSYLRGRPSGIACHRAPCVRPMHVPEVANSYRPLSRLQALLLPLVHWGQGVVMASHFHDAWGTTPSFVTLSKPSPYIYNELLFKTLLKL